MLRLLCYVLIGPPLGGLVFFPAAYMLHLWGLGGAAFRVTAWFPGMAMVALVAYAPGLLPAMLSWIVVTVAERRRGMPSLLLVALAGVIAAALSWGLYEILFVNGIADLRYTLPVFLVTGALMATVCELLVRRLRRRRDGGRRGVMSAAALSSGERRSEWSDEHSSGSRDERA